MRAEVYLALQPGAAIQIELLTAHVAAGHVRWAANKEIGVAFNEPIPAAAMLAHCSFENNAANSRPPRLRVDLRGLFRLGAEAKVVSIGNISQAGLQIAAPTPLRIGEACSIALPHLPARAAAICWWREGHAGLMLNEPFDYPTFAQRRASFP